MWRRSRHPPLHPHALRHAFINERALEIVPLAALQSTVRHAVGRGARERGRVRCLEPDDQAVADGAGRAFVAHDQLELAPPCMETIEGSANRGRRARTVRERVLRAARRTAMRDGLGLPPGPRRGSREAPGDPARRGSASRGLDVGDATAALAHRTRLVLHRNSLRAPPGRFALPGHDPTCLRKEVFGVKSCPVSAKVWVQAGPVTQ